MSRPMHCISVNEEQSNKEQQGHGVTPWVEAHIRKLVDSAKDEPIRAELKMSARARGGQHQAKKAYCEKV